MKSNCLLEAFRAKIRNRKTNIYLIVVEEEKFPPHFCFTENNKMKHFSHEGKLKWYKSFYFEGTIKDLPDRYLKKVKLKKII